MINRDYGLDDDSNVTTIRVPGYRQSQTFSCGFVAGLMVIHTFFPRRSANAFWLKTLPHREFGLTTSRLVDGLRKTKIRVAVRRNLTFDDIENEIASGRPIIALVKHKRDEDRWVVIYGVGRNPKRVFIAGNSLPHVASCVWSWGDYCRQRTPNGDCLICSAK